MAPLSPETAMDLILWRHAEAEVGSDDLARRLTVRGAKQARQMAAWLKPRPPKHTRIPVSPAVRPQQTADALDAAIHTDPRTRDSIWQGVSLALGSLADPRVLDAVSPGEGEDFDP